VHLVDIPVDAPKVTLIISQVVGASGRRGGDAELHEVAERIRALVEDGRL
jgi:hypothetical protein